MRRRKPHHRKREPKARTQRRHATTRFLERHGLEVTGRDLDNMVAMIQRGEATFVERQSNRVTVWDVMYEERNRRVVYDNKRKTIVTTHDPTWAD